MSTRSTGCPVQEGTRRLEGFIALLIAILVLLVGRLFVSVVTVHDYERGLRYRQGRFSGLVDPGTHLVVRPISEIRVLDGRPAFMTIEGQEVLTADGVALKVSLVARYVVGDPVAAVTGDQSFARALYLELQLGLRETLAAGTVDDILGSRSKIGPAVLERIASPLARIGIELLSVEVRDLMLPGELKRLFAGVVAARKDGEAELERVRAETAALRNLANAGRMVEDNPGLLQLRILQQLGSTSGNTVMLTMPDGQTPVTPGPAATRTRSSGAGRGRETEPPGDA
jgi:regulator of protease activity HflC (stomatin/prohibitin superfamily)